MRHVFSLGLFALLVAPLAVAHTLTADEPMGHITVKSLSLEPGESQNFSIIPGMGEGPWRAGDTLVLFVWFFSPPQALSVKLVYNHTDILEDWLLGVAPAKANYLTAMMPRAQGPYELVFANPATDSTAQFYFYFDQTCSCSMKPIPLDDGWVVFHYDLRAGQGYQLGVPMDEGWTVDGKLAKRPGANATWPDDYEILQETTAQGPAWVNFTVFPDEDARYFLLLFAREGTGFDASGAPTPIFMTPLLEGAKKPGKPDPTVGVALACAAIAIGLWRVRRS